MAWDRLRIFGSVDDRGTQVDGDKPKRSRFKSYPPDYFHINIAEVHTVEGRFYLFVTIDRTTRFAFVGLHERVTRRVCRVTAYAGHHPVMRRVAAKQVIVAKAERASILGRSTTFLKAALRIGMLVTGAFVAAQWPAP